MATLGDLIIKLSLDAAGFVSDTGKAGYAAEKFAGNMRKSFNQASDAARSFSQQFSRTLGNLGAGVGEGVGRLGESLRKTFESLRGVSAIGGSTVAVFAGIGIAATAAAAGITALDLAVAKQADEMSDAADAAQINADAFQAMAIAAKQAGIDTGAFLAMMNKLNQAIAEGAQGTNQVAEDFARLGVALTSGGNLRNTADIMRDTAKALAALPPSAEKARLELEFFGKSGTKADSFFKTFDERVKAAAESGAIFGAKLRALADQTDDATTDMSSAFQAWKNTVAVATLPEVIALIKLFTSFINDTRKLAEETGLLKLAMLAASGVLKGFGLAIAAVADVARITMNVFLSLIDVVDLLALSAYKVLEALGRLAKLDLSGAKQSLLDIGDASLEVYNRIAGRFGKPLYVKQFLDSVGKAASDAQKAADDAAAGSGDRGRLAKLLAQQQQDARTVFEKTSREADTARREAQQAFQQTNSTITRQSSEITISLDQEYDKRLAAQKKFTDETLAAYDREIAGAQQLQNAKSAAGKPLFDAATRAAQETKVNELLARRNEAVAAGKDAEEQLKTAYVLGQRAFQRALDETDATVLELTGHLEEAANVRFNSQHLEQQLRLQAEGNKKDLDKLETQKQLLTQQLRFNEALAEADRIQNQLGRTEAVIAAQVRSGRRTDFEAAAAINDARRKTIALNQQEIEKLQQLGTVTNEQKERLADLIAQNEILANSIDEVGKAINDAFIGAAADALVEFVEHTKSAEEAFNDFAKSVVHAINQMIAQELAKKLFRSLFGADTTQGAAGIGGFLSSLFGASAAGAAGGSSTLAQSTTSTVVYAQAMAGGGMFSPNDLLLVGEKGPELIRPSFSGQVVPNGQSVGGNVSVSMNVTTPDAASFQRSQGQILTSMALASQRALARR